MSYEKLTWQQVSDAVDFSNRRAKGWHKDLWEWVATAEDNCHDYYNEEGIDWNNQFLVPLDELHRQYFAYLADTLCSEGFRDAKTTAIARKFFKNLGVEW